MHDEGRAEATPVEDGRSILVVLVLYRRPLDAAAAWPLVSEWLTRDPGGGDDLRVTRALVYDNSESSQIAPGAGGPRWRVIRNPLNAGTRGAYLAAIEEAQAWGCSWVLLLDHDSTLPADYLERLNLARRASPRSPACAWLPRVVAGGETISPAWLMPSGRVQTSSDASPVEGALCLTAVASGALFERRALEQALPPERVWLDGVDHWIFIRLHRAQKEVQRFDATIEHELSTHDYATLSLARCRSILGAVGQLRRQLPWIATLMAPIRVGWFMFKLARANPRTAARLLMHRIL